MVLGELIVVSLEVQGERFLEDGAAGVEARLRMEGAEGHLAQGDLGSAELCVEVAHPSQHVFVSGLGLLEDTKELVALL